VDSNTVYRFDDAIYSNQKTITVSGIIVDPNGYIVSNYHSLAGASVIYVTIFGGAPNKYAAKIIRYDENNDLALLKIPATELPIVKISDSSKIEAGDIVFAIGSPFGFEHSVTSGIISDNKRDLIIEGRPYRDMIQTDAAINTGNSGGPLVDVYGRVIGINTAIWAPTGVFTGIGFAIPINRVKSIIKINQL